MHVVTVHDPFHPLRHREIRKLTGRRRICTLAPKTSKPFIAVLNGDPVLRKDWKRCIEQDDVLTFVMLPQGGGGGGSNPLRMILTLAMVVAAVEFGPEVGAFMGLSGTTATSVGSAMIMVGGTMLINAIAPVKTNGMADIPAASPTYALTAQSNVARVAQPIPVQYGRMRVYPDFAAQPYVEYFGNEQYLYELMCIGQGQYSVEAVKIGNTPVSSFQEIQYEIIPPGSAPTLFPANVSQSTAVSGQELVNLAGTSYSQSGSNIFVATNTSVRHTYVGELVWLAFTSGTSVSGVYAVTAVSNPGTTGAYTFEVGANDSQTTDGAVAIGTVLGPFVANDAGTSCNAIGIDLVCPKGQFYANNNGGLDARSATVILQAQLIDQVGAVLGPWFNLGGGNGEQSISGATTTAIRNSYRFDVSGNGGGQQYPRFQVRAFRVDAKDTNSRSGNDIDWGGLRAYMPDTNNYGNVTLLAVRAQATNNLSSDSARQINVICTRMIPTVTATGPGSLAATRSMASALVDAATNSIYGGSVKTANIDWPGLYALDQTLAARGDYLDIRFDTAGTLWDALAQIGSACRTKPFMQGGILHAMRDQPATLPVALFSMRNIVQNSLSIQYMTPTDVTADSVQVTYFDNTVWQQETITCTLAGGTNRNPAKVSILGATDRAHAYREGLYQAACNRYRRKIIKFQTEAEGFIPSFGDLIAITHDMPAWGQTAEVTGWNAATNTLTVNENLTWSTTSANYVGLRKRDGSIDGPYQVSQGNAANTLILTSSPSFTPYTGMSEERTHIAFGAGDTWRQPARVMAVQPRGPYLVEITAVNEDPSVHTADQGLTAPALAYSRLPSINALPTVVGLQILIDVTGATPQYVASWAPAAGADHYVVETSGDGGNTWSSLTSVPGTSYRWPANNRATANVRVAGVNIGRGAWTTASVSYASAPSTPTGLATSVVGAAVQLSWSPNPELDVIGYEIRTSDTGWGTAGALFSGSSLTATVVPAAGTSPTWYLRAYDFLGNYSAASASITFTPAAVVNPTNLAWTFNSTSMTSATVTLTWTDAAPQFGLDSYLVSYGSTMTTVRANSITVPANWVGSQTFTITSVDKLGAVSSGLSKIVVALAPNSPANFTSQVIDNNVMLYWTAPATTTLPISHYMLYKGPTFATATPIGRKDGMFTTINELSNGTFTYWITTVDTAGNASAPASLAAVVAQPPDFIFYGKLTSTFSGTLSSAYVEAGKLIMPVNTSQTFASHFTANGWNTPQDQINAGQPIYIEPASGTGTYTETFDFGTVVASSSVTVAMNAAAVSGSPTVATTCATSPDGVSWTTFTGSSVYATGFRYVKVTISATANAPGDLYSVSGLTVTLNAKLRNDAGSVSCNASDTSGTLANFNFEFMDVTSITATAAGSTPITAVYDFMGAIIAGTYSIASNVCTVNATAHDQIVGQRVRLEFTNGTGISGVYTVTSATTNSFTVALTAANGSGNVSMYSQGLRVYLFNSSGARVSGSASWSIKGY